MRKADIFRLGLKNITKSLWIISIVIAVATYGLFVSVGALSLLAEEKSAPLELNVSAEGINDYDVLALSEIEYVLAASPVISGQSTLTLSDFSAELPVLGIDGEYIEEFITSGGIFAENSAMPYLVLNTAAQEALLQSSTARDNTPYEYEQPQRDTDVDIIDVDWLTDVEIGNAPSVSGKICGIIEDESPAPIVYMSLNSAKTLYNSQYTGAVVRTTDSGHESPVSKDISALGLFVQNSNNAQISDWESRQNEAVYLLLCAAILLICTCALLILSIKLHITKSKRNICALYVSGVSRGRICNIYRLPIAFISIFSLIFAVILALCVPAFVSPEMQDSMFKLSLSGVSLLIGCVITSVFALASCSLIRLKSPI